MRPLEILVAFKEEDDVREREVTLGERFIARRESLPVFEHAHTIQGVKTALNSGKFDCAVLDVSIAINPSNENKSRKHYDDKSIAAFADDFGNLIDCASAAKTQFFPVWITALPDPYDCEQGYPQYQAYNSVFMRLRSQVMTRILVPRLFRDEERQKLNLKPKGSSGDSTNFDFYFYSFREEQARYPSRRNGADLYLQYGGRPRNIILDETGRQKIYVGEHTFYRAFILAYLCAMQKELQGKTTQEQLVRLDEDQFIKSLYNPREPVRPSSTTMRGHCSSGELYYGSRGFGYFKGEYDDDGEMLSAPIHEEFRCNDNKLVVHQIHYDGGLFRSYKTFELTELFPGFDMSEFIQTIFLKIVDRPTAYLEAMVR